MQSPPAVQVTVPWVPLVLPVTVSVSPSGSVSLASTLAMPEVFSLVASVSSTAFGASLTGVTVTVTVAVSVPPLPSLIV